VVLAGIVILDTLIGEGILAAILALALLLVEIRTWYTELLDAIR